MFAAGVVEVLAGGENLHRFRAGTRGKFQQSRVQTLIEEQVGGEHSQHVQGRSFAPADLGWAVSLFYCRILASIYPAIVLRIMVPDGILADFEMHSDLAHQQPEAAD